MAIAPLVIRWGPETFRPTYSAAPLTAPGAVANTPRCAIRAGQTRS